MSESLQVILQCVNGYINLVMLSAYHSLTRTSLNHSESKANSCLRSACITPPNASVVALPAEPLLVLKSWVFEPSWTLLAEELQEKFDLTTSANCCPPVIH